MRNFAHWTTAPAIAGLEETEEFVVDIPDETSREDVICKLALEYGATIGDADGLGFYEEWPSEIRRQFDSLEADSQLVFRWHR